MDVISFNNLGKKFGSNNSFKNFNLTVAEGEILGLVGPKNSFKSTLLRMAMDFIRPSSGNIKVFDLDSRKKSKEIKEITSFIPQEVWFHDNLRPIALFKNTLKVHKFKNREELYELIDYFEVDMKGKLGDMSHNNRKKIAVVNALISKPSLLLVDEPNSILDPVFKARLYDLIAEKNREGMTVLISTSDMREAQSICDRIAYLNDGEIIEIEDQRTKLSNDKILRYYDQDVNSSIFDSIGAKLVRRESETVYYYNRDLNVLAKAIYDANLIDYSVEDSTLEDKLTVFDRETSMPSDFQNKVEPEPVVVEEVVEEIVEEVEVGTEDMSVSEETIVIETVETEVEVADEVEVVEEEEVETDERI